MCGRVGGAALWIVVIVLLCFCIGRRRFGITVVAVPVVAVLVVTVP